MQTKFCIEVIDQTVKVDISGKGSEIISLLSSVMEQDEQIRRIVTESLVALIISDMMESKDQEKDSETQLKEMLSKMKIGLA